MPTQNDTNDIEGKGNTKLSPRSRAYCITINNYEVNIFDTLTQLFCKNVQFIFGKEIGENGTKHIQGYVKFKNARSFKSMKKLLPRAHIEKAKGNIKQNFVYCSKENDFITNIDFRTKQEKLKEDVLESEYKNVTWKPWQLKIIEDLKKSPDKRKINWYWESQGNIGKSYLVKYLALTQDIIIAAGKKDNIFNQINTLLETGKTPKVILMDVPRDSLEYINYSAIEQIKNGCLYSGKYEGGICLYKIPHVYVFANEKPNTKKLSPDRWNIVDLGTGINSYSPREARGESGVHNNKP